MNQETHNIVKETVEELLRKLGYEARVSTQELLENNKKTIVCDVRVEEDSRILIGQKGTNLASFEHLGRILTRRKLTESTYITVDVNNYNAQKKQQLKKQAQEAARQALQEKKPVILPPMTSRDRRLIHTALVDNEKVTTESIGEQENRQVVVKPASVGGKLS